MATSRQSTASDAASGSFQIRLENGELAIFKREKTCAEPLNHDNLGKAYILHYLTKDDVNVFIEAGML